MACRWYKSAHHAEYDLELAEADGVDGLGHCERVVRHHATVTAQGFNFFVKKILKDKLF
jgi:hypothetical protein